MSTDVNLLDLATLGLDVGGAILLRHALLALPVGGRVSVQGSNPSLPMQLRAMCRAEGHSWHPAVAGSPHVGEVERGSVSFGRWQGATRAGGAHASEANAVHESPPDEWGLAPRGAWVESGGPSSHFPLHLKSDVWSEEAARVYMQAAGAQWDPSTAIPWDHPVENHEVIEHAVVQLMTYLVENETAALIIPAKFAAQVHPHFHEVLQVLAIQAADEARHIEVFTRRALLKGGALGLSTVGGRASLHTLTSENDFAVASFLLSVLGEGTFLSLLRFLHVHAPDSITREIAKLTGQDEARHVAFGISHLTRHLEYEPELRDRLARAVENRHSNLQHTSGLNEEVFDALVILAAGEPSPTAIGRGFQAVIELQNEMNTGRVARLRRLGFTQVDAEKLSALHTRNFM